ncbi:hypothetical protein CLOM_g189, partial [Closterium sp. NIES-68]
LGLNINRGREIRIRLRPAGKPDSFFPYEHVLGTMLHELTHIERGPHDAKFYKLLDDLNVECDDLIAQGITGTPFGGSGHRLGTSAYPSIRPVRLGSTAAVVGFSAPPAYSAAAASEKGLSAGVSSSVASSAADVASRKAAAAAAERRRQQHAVMMPAGGRRLGGDSEIMRVLAPVQAAAMAAERRMRDDVWCGRGHEWEGGENRGEGRGEGTGVGGKGGGEKGRRGGVEEEEEEEWESAREVGDGGVAPAELPRALDGARAMGERSGDDVGSGLGGKQWRAVGERFERERLRSGREVRESCRRHGSSSDCCDCRQGAGDAIAGEDGKAGDTIAGDDGKAGGSRKRPCGPGVQGNSSNISNKSSTINKGKTVTVSSASVGAEAVEQRTRSAGGFRVDEQTGRAGGGQQADRPDSWTCPVCTLINQGIVLQCEACLAVRPSPGSATNAGSSLAVNAADGSGASTAILIDDNNCTSAAGVAAGGGWDAGGGAGAAVVAGASRDAARKAGRDVGRDAAGAARSAVWTCCQCTLENVAAVDRCQVCDSWRYALA